MSDADARQTHAAAGTRALYTLCTTATAAMAGASRNVAHRHVTKRVSICQRVERCGEAHECCRHRHQRRRLENLSKSHVRVATPRVAAPFAATINSARAGVI